MRWLLALSLVVLLSTSSRAGSDPSGPAEKPPIYIAFLWHMHQPVYYPGETVVQTELAGHFTFSVKNVHTERQGPYTTWVRDAVLGLRNASFPFAGTQVSFTGSLVRNLNALENAGTPQFQNWKSTWQTVAGWRTSLNNPQVDLVGFGLFHPLMGLLDEWDIVQQVTRHREALQTAFGAAASKGIFPPENAFSVRMIPALVRAGLEWVIVDNIHFDRAAEGYPWSSGSNLMEPNGADVRNPNPNDWLQLTGLWMPSPASARWSRTPHFAEYVDPATGEASRIIVVPGDRYPGTEDARGGFGALNYEGVLSQLESVNTDPNHPILVVLPHDGDNFGGGSDSYYHSNFTAFISWLQAHPSRFVCTTIQDYLDRFPPDPSDVVHVEDGSWSGADNGDPQFLKWNGGTDVNGYSPDRASWSIVTAARNIVRTAWDNDSTSDDVRSAVDYALMSEASDYWYWDGTEVWDSNPARASNLAVTLALPAAVGSTDRTAPTIHVPQRAPYNPGGTEWGTVQPSDLRVWTLAYDLSGLKSVRLKWRTGIERSVGAQNFTYSGGPGVSAWTTVEMSPAPVPAKTDPLPAVRALKFEAPINGLKDTLVDYYVEAEDSVGNVGRSPIQHVYVGDGPGGTGSPVISWIPSSPTKHDTLVIAVRSRKGGNLHWGVGRWTLPHSVYWPAGSSKWFDDKAVESPFAPPDSTGTMRIAIGPFDNPAQNVDSISFVIHYADNSWDNNGGKDYFIPLGSVTRAGTNEGLPTGFRLMQNFPNPFNPQTVIGYQLPALIGVTGSAASRVELRIFDMLGREVGLLVDEVQQPGAYAVTWNAEGLPSGLYLCRLTAGGGHAVIKMMLLK